MVSNNGTFNFITKPDPSGEVSPDDECSGHTGTSDEIFSDSQIANKSKMTIASNGRIGIGTTLPYTKFHIKGTSQTDAVLFLEPGEWNSAGDYSEIRFGDATHYIRGEHTNGMKFYDANQFSFTGGNVGIGTIDPKSALHIKSDDGTLSLEGITHTYIQYYPDGVDAGRKAWTGFGSSDDNNFTIANEISGANIILSLNGGNVGIGTSNPGSYKLAVEGKIGARAIKITLAPWADFVFEKNYSLTPLNNLESFINKNKHLPNIPPAHEIEKNGLDVAEIIAKQMQKIEELTLYLIELNKKIQKLEFEYNTLKK
ncbi:MAG: hypothetical protein A2491_01430 [Bacteroidetes bacterium RIFOXYC12_FULL_35_7]|nr:MAG: hypothetical protein A2491_01430 [Bacteroidetes bacterium RIFOXYC12_FULL_35_7]